LPTGADLSVATISGLATNGSQAFYSAVFASPATVTAGVTYALVVRPSTNPAAGKLGLSRAGTSVFGQDVYPNGALINSANAGSTWVVQTYNSTDPSINTADAGFITYIHGGYAQDGNLVSDVLDSNPPAGATPAWTSLSWSATTPAQTTL